MQTTSVIVVDYSDRVTPTLTCQHCCRHEGAAWASSAGGGRGLRAMCRQQRSRAGGIDGGGSEMCGLDHPIQAPTGNDSNGDDFGRIDSEMWFRRKCSGRCRR
ncbi:hypothetical protein ACLOJK_006859 [Asimina triloba]